MMIMRTGDLNPNRFARGYSGMESLKQAMLQHELIFRSQVRELHRLYWTQKNLMNELHRKCFDAHATSNSSRVALTKCKGSTDEKSEFSESSCARENVSSVEQCKGRPAEVLSNHAINFSLHLPADEFIRDTCVDLPYRHTVIEVAKSNKCVDATEKDKVGCGLEEAIAEKDMRRHASSFSCKEAINLEAAVELECREEANEVFFGFRAPIHKGASMFGSQPTTYSVQFSSITVGNEMRHIPSMVYSDEGHDGTLQGQKPSISSAGFGDSCIATLVDHSRIIQEGKPVLIDLNMPLEDECSHDLNDPAEDAKFKFASSSNSEHVQINLAEASLIPKPSSSNSVTKAACDNQADCSSCHDQDSKPLSSLESKPTLGTAKNIDDTKITTSCHVQVECCGKHVEGSTDSNNGAFINVKSTSFFSIISNNQEKRDADFPSVKRPSTEYSDNKRQYSNITSSNSTNLTQSIIRDSVSKLGIHEGSEEDTLSSHAIAQDDSQRHAPSRKLSTGCNSVSRSQDKIAKEPVVLNSTDDSVITQLNSSQNDGSSIAAAAEVLMGFSSERSAISVSHQPVDVEMLEVDCDNRNNQPLHSSDSFEMLEVDCDNRNNQPLHSSDSFESMTLQLSEVQSEDHLNISELPNLTETGKNVSRPRLRRGRGLRDFQKEILPGIASLARHEICEDLHNIGHKLRRTASRNARESWFVPVQGRRSRLHSGRQGN